MKSSSITIGMVLFVFLVSFGFFYSLIQVASLPDVHISYSTKECVTVINYDSEHNYTCDNYPKKYNHIWVQ